MFASKRLALLLAPCLLLVFLSTRAALIWDLAVICLALLDAFLAPKPLELRVERENGTTVRLGQPSSSRITIINTAKRTMRGSLRDAWVPSAGASDNFYQFNLAPGERRRFTTQLQPKRRGKRRADYATVRSLGPLGLAGRQRSLVAPAHVQVLPPFNSRKHLPSRLNLLREMDGRSAVMVRGAGTEFDSLRQYVPGDDVRSIDWRSTARRGEVVVRTWRPERDRHVLIIIDCARHSATRMEEGTRLDVSIDSSFLLSALASAAGDRVEVMALDTRRRAWIAGKKSGELIAAMANELADVEPYLGELSAPALNLAASQRLSQHALVVLLSSLEAVSHDQALTDVLAMIAHKHTLIFASAINPQIEQMSHERDNADLAYQAAAAERTLLETNQARSQLKRLGIEVVESAPATLAPALADTYLALKAAGRL